MGCWRSRQGSCSSLTLVWHGQFVFVAVRRAKKAGRCARCRVANAALGLLQGATLAVFMHGVGGGRGPLADADLSPLLGGICLLGRRMETGAGTCRPCEPGPVADKANRRSGPESVPAEPWRCDAVAAALLAEEAPSPPVTRPGGVRPLVRVTGSAPSLALRHRRQALCMRSLTCGPPVRRPRGAERPAGRRAGPRAPAGTGGVPKGVRTPGGRRPGGNRAGRMGGGMEAQGSGGATGARLCVHLEMAS